MIAHRAILTAHLLPSGSTRNGSDDRLWPNEYAEYFRQDAGEHSVNAESDLPEPDEMGANALASEWQGPVPP
jgi:hypothetical protein